MTDINAAEGRESQHLCCKCFQYVELTECRLVHLNDGLPALSGHWREGELCGPVLQTDREPEELTEDELRRWKPICLIN